MLAAAGCGGDGASGGPAPSWERPNHDLRSTRAAGESAIDAATVEGLEAAWRFRIPTEPHDSSGVVTSTPVVAAGVVYLQDMRSNVFAIDVESGALRWQHEIGFRNPGPNGVALSGGRVYGATDESVFALDGSTGRRLWTKRILSDVEYFVDVAPQVAGRRVYASTVGYSPRGRGALYALDTESGRVVWRFDTIKERWRFPLEAGGGGAWHTPSLDDGRVYWGIANPTPWGGTARRPNGGSFPGPALYTDSLVVLDAKRGRLEWFDQVTPHDIRDYDFQLPPVLGRAGDREAVFGAGKAGIVIAWDRATGARLWERRVGLHRNDRGPLPRRLVEVCPGLYGGVETPLALADGRLFVPVVNLCSRGSAIGYEPLEHLDPSAGTGELQALEASTGRVLWTRKLPLPTFGCATVANDVVFTSTFDGTVYAFGARDGAPLWSTKMRAGINACPAVAGDRLLVAAGVGDAAELVAFAIRR